MKTHELVDIIGGQIEDENTPAMMLSWTAAREGKPIRSNNIPAGFQLRREFGMTHVETPDYRATGGRKGVSYQLAYTDTGAVWPAPSTGEELPGKTRGLRELNPCYYRGREERNGLRRALLSDSLELEKVSAAVTAVRRAVESYRKAVMALEEVTAYGEKASPDRYLLQDLAGIIKEERK